MASPIAGTAYLGWSRVNNPRYVRAVWGGLNLKVKNKAGDHLGTFGEDYGPPNC